MSTTTATRPFTWRTEAQELATLFKDEIKGKVVLVTGVSPKASGTEIVRAIAPYAKTVIVASRSASRAEEALTIVRQESPKADFRVVELDLADEASIRTAAAAVLAFKLPINVLIANAAAPILADLERTKRGFETQFGANHLGHFLFTSLIFPALRSGGSSASSPARYVAVASIAITFGAVIRWDDSNFTKKPEEYNKYGAYGQSKLANVLFAKELTRKYASENVVGYSLHPGAIWTSNMGSAVPPEDLVMMGLATADGKPAFEGANKTLAQGAATSVAAAFDPTISSQPGSFLNDSEIYNEQLPASVNDEDAAKAWELSEKIWGIKFGETA